MPATRYQPTDANLGNRSNPNAGAGLLGYVYNEDATGRTAHDKLSERVSVLDFGAVGDGVTDDTAALKTAIDAVSSTGGTIHFPNLKYRLTSTIKVPKYVSLVSEAGLKETDTSLAATFLIDHGAGDGAVSAFLLDKVTEMRGFVFHYPGQVGTTASAPIVYGPCIATDQSKGYALDGIVLRDLSFNNAYDAINLTWAGRFTVENVFGYPLHSGIYIDKMYDAGRISDAHFYPTYICSFGSNLQVWCNANARAFDLRNVDGLSMRSCFCYGYHEGYYLRAGAVSGSPWVTLVACTADNTNIPVYVDAVDFAEIIGGTFITNNTRYCPISTSTAIGGAVKVTGVTFYGLSAIGALISSNDGRFLFTGCDFDYQGANKILYQPIISEGDCDVVVSGCTGFDDKVPFGNDHVVLDGRKLFPLDEDLAPTGFDMTTWAAGVPGGWALSGGTITEMNSPDGVEITLAASGTERFLDYAIPQALKDRNEAYVVEFDYQPKAVTTGFTLYFKICKSDGTQSSILHGQNAVFWTKGTPAQKVKIRLPIILGYYPDAQVLRIAWRNTRDAGATANGTLEITNPKWYRSLPKNTTNAQIENIHRRVFLDPLSKGLTHGVDGANVVNIAGDAPTAGAWVVGDRVTVPAASGGVIGKVCTTAGSPGTWKGYGAIA